MILEKGKEGKDNIRPIQTKRTLALMLLPDQTNKGKDSIQWNEKGHFMSHSEHHSQNDITLNYA